MRNVRRQGISTSPASRSGCARVAYPLWPRIRSHASICDRRSARWAAVPLSPDSSANGRVGITAGAPAGIAAVTPTETVATILAGITAGMWPTRARPIRTQDYSDSAARTCRTLLSAATCPCAHSAARTCRLHAGTCPYVHLGAVFFNIRDMASQPACASSGAIINMASRSLCASATELPARVCASACSLLKCTPTGALPVRASACSLYMWPCTLTGVLLVHSNAGALRAAACTTLLLLLSPALNLNLSLIHI